MERMHSRIKRICIIAGLLLAIMAILYGRQLKLQKVMDAREVHYDADNYFLMIDAKHRIAGFYYCAHPLTHMRIRTNALDGVYDAYFHDGSMFLELTNIDATIEVRITKRQAAWIEEHYKDGYPALVYRE